MYITYVQYIYMYLYISICHSDRKAAGHIYITYVQYIHMYLYISICHSERKAAGHIMAAPETAVPGDLPLSGRGKLSSAYIQQTNKVYKRKHQS